MHTSPPPPNPRLSLHSPTFPHSPTHPFTGEAFGSTTFTNSGTAGTNQDSYLLRLNAANGAVMWANKIGGTKDHIMYSVATDLQGNVYGTGLMNSPSITLNNGMCERDPPGQGQAPPTEPMGVSFIHFLQPFPQASPSHWWIRGRATTSSSSSGPPQGSRSGVSRPGMLVSILAGPLSPAFADNGWPMLSLSLPIGKVFGGTTGGTYDTPFAIVADDLGFVYITGYYFSASIST